MWDVPPITVVWAMYSVFFGLHEPWPGDVNEGEPTMVVWLLGAQVRVPPVASADVLPVSVLLVLSFPDVNRHFLNTTLVEIFPVIFEHVVPEAALAAGAIETTAMPVGTATVAIGRHHQDQSTHSIPLFGPMVTGLSTYNGSPMRGPAPGSTATIENERFEACRSRGPMPGDIPPPLRTIWSCQERWTAQMP